MAAPTSTSTSISIWTRKLDLLYLVFFIIHVPIIFLVDITPLYPASLTPRFILRIREFYIETYHDKFFEHPPAWFGAYILMELVYHVPVSVWAVGGLVRDDPLVPLHLLIWAVQAFLTTLTCLVEVWSWTDRTREEKANISMLYGPYVGFAALMGVDMFWRLRKQLVQKTTKKGKAE
ncbi:hypothetical protein VTN77DRAFT_7353 [Rasamsonia byssochlamydoides]|uniref:uncharacterized protein n=1 Tax=Rasamsonia byssochlamydoides TaxID=89139 RepID=UPI00374212EF